eukprot:g1236.t1
MGSGASSGASVVEASDSAEREVIRKFQQVFEMDKRSRAKVVQTLSSMADTMLETVGKTVSAHPMPEEIRVTVLSAVVERADILSESDCYVTLQLGKEGKIKMTRTKSNKSKPSFDETFTFVPTPGTKRLPKLLVSCWDRDFGSDKEHDPEGADFLGAVEIDLNEDPLSRNSFGVAMGFTKGDRAGNITLRWHSIYPEMLSPKTQKSRAKPAEDGATKNNDNVTKEDSSKKSGDNVGALKDTKKISPQQQTSERDERGNFVVTRENILDMNDEGVTRFLNAVREMMKAIDGKPETGEYFRLAGYHGWPNNYCAHRQEIFPSWHRAYLLEFERCLQKADMKLGNDGNIGVPYWEFGDVEREGPVIHPLVRAMKFPKEDMIADPNGDGAKLYARGYSRIGSDDDIREKLRAANVGERLKDSLKQNEHWKFASARWGGGTSLETPHNIAHTVVGWPLASVRFAAFHPIFYMIHANVDRYLDKYLELESDSEEEFKQCQRRLQLENGETNRYENALAPFEHPDTGEDFHCTHTFKSRDLVHVFVVKNGESDAFEPPSDTKRWSSHPNYASMGAIFGGKGNDCVNCKESKPVNVFVDISQCLARLSLTRHDVNALVWVFDVNAGSMIRLKDVKDVVIPEPRIEGHMFHSVDRVLEEIAEAAESKASKSTKDDDDDDDEVDDVSTRGEVCELQRHLEQYGYYGGKIDGHFGPATADAVRNFQRNFGLMADGKAGPVTKSVMSMTRVDDKRDVLGDKDEVDSDGSTKHFKSGSFVYYVIGIAPGTIRSRKALVREFSKAFEQWSEATGLRFVYEANRGRSAKRVAADISKRGDQVVLIQWKSKEQDAHFDGVGGTLADAGKNFITFDASERWRLSDQAATKAGTYRIFEVALHEIGHVVGLTHSDKPEDVMSPFYVANRVALTRSDALRARALYFGDEKNKK